VRQRVREFRTCRITSISDRGGNRAPRGRRSVGASQPPQMSHRRGAGRGGAGRATWISHSRRSRHEFVASKMPTRPISIPPARVHRPLSTRTHAGPTARRRARARQSGGSAGQGPFTKSLRSLSAASAAACRALTPSGLSSWNHALGWFAPNCAHAPSAQAPAAGRNGGARRNGPGAGAGRWWVAGASGVGGGCRQQTHHVAAVVADVENLGRCAMEKGEVALQFVGDVRLAPRGQPDHCDH
jgi:hypothetical protein